MTGAPGGPHPPDATATRPEDPPGQASPGSEPFWTSGSALRLHVALLAGLALAGTATWLEWSRARAGHAIAWIYAFEWPLFAVLGTYLWWRLLHADGEPARRKGPAPDPDPPLDPGLLAWQAYLDRLHQADPPGGPPRSR